LQVARFASIAGKTRGRYAFASDRSLLAGLLAAIVHDYGHSGKSNAYHVALGDYIARQFNDQQASAVRPQTPLCLIVI
jgi:hypothetical protein